MFLKTLINDIINILGEGLQSFLDEVRKYEKIKNKD